MDWFFFTALISTTHLNLFYVKKYVRLRNQNSTRRDDTSFYRAAGHRNATERTNWHGENTRCAGAQYAAAYDEP